MTGDLFSPNSFTAVILFMVWSLAAFWMGRPAAAKQLGRFRLHCRILLGLAGAGLALTAARIAIAWSLWPSGWWPLRNGLILHVPLLVLPAVSVAVFTVPRLWKMARAGLGEPDQKMGKAFRRRVSDPRFVVPVQAAMWGAGTMVYFIYFTAVPLDTMDALIPLLVTACVVAALALRQRFRWMEARLPDEKQPGRIKRFARASFTLVLVAAGCITLMVMGA